MGEEGATAGGEMELEVCRRGDLGAWEMGREAASEDGLLAREMAV